MNGQDSGEQAPEDATTGQVPDDAAEQGSMPLQDADQISATAGPAEPLGDVIALTGDGSDETALFGGGPNHALVVEGRNERERVLLRQMYRLDQAIEDCLTGGEICSTETTIASMRVAAVLAKTSAQLFDAIERARRRGEQRVVVEHVASERPSRGRTRRPAAATTPASQSAKRTA